MINIIHFSFLHFFVYLAIISEAVKDARKIFRLFKSNIEYQKLVGILLNDEDNLLKIFRVLGQVFFFFYWFFNNDLLKDNIFLQILQGILFLAAIFLHTVVIYLICYYFVASFVVIGLRSKHIYSLQSNTTVFGSFAYLYLFLIMLNET